MKSILNIFIIIGSLCVIGLIIFLIKNSKDLTYDCKSRKCTINKDGKGKYKTLDDCQNSQCVFSYHDPDKGYDCKKGKCIINKDGK